MKKLPRPIQGAIKFCGFFVGLVAFIQAFSYYFNIDDQVKEWLGNHRSHMAAYLAYAVIVFGIYWWLEEPKP